MSGASGLLGGLVLTGCQDQRPADGSSSSPSPSSAAETTTQAPSRTTAPARRSVTTADWRAWARGLDGRLSLPADASYGKDKLVFNTLFDGARPAAVLRAGSADDVSAALQLAHRFGLRVAPRGGGHSYIGASAADGALVVDTRDLDLVRYDPAARTATVGCGAALYSVHERLARRGRGVPTGTCPTVGAAGLTLGGGLGVESREHGLTCDVLRSATVVLPDGSRTETSRTQEPDLFWALRGGGGATAAVVTELVYDTHAVSDRGTFTAAFPSEQGVAVLTGWARWVAETETTRWANLHVDADGHGGLAVRVVGVTSSGDEAAALEDLARAVGTDPLRSATRRRDPMGTVRWLGGGSTSPRQGFTAGSDVLATLPAQTAQQVLGAVREHSRAGGRGSALLDPLTGHVQSTVVGESAFPWRRHVASVQWYVSTPTHVSARTAQRWIGRSHAAVRAGSVGGYVNYLEAGQAGSRYYGGGAARLRAVRARLDPEGRLSPGVRL